VFARAGIADTLGIHLGDRLSFDVGGAIGPALHQRARTELGFDEGKLFQHHVAGDAARPAVRRSINSIFVPRGGPESRPALVREFRNMTVITPLVMAQIRSVMDQRLSSAVQFVFLFALGPVVLVLYAATVATQDERDTRRP